MTEYGSGIINLGFIGNGDKTMSLTNEQNTIDSKYIFVILVEKATLNKYKLKSATYTINTLSKSKLSFVYV